MTKGPDPPSGPSSVASARQPSRGAARRVRVSRMRTPVHARAGVVAALAVLATAAPASANVALNRISSDPFTNTTSQHRTEVEPDTFANGSTVVSAFQVGRFFDGGASDVGWSRSG